MDTRSQGFVFITSLLLVSLLATMMTIGLLRSTTEVQATQRSVAFEQAFHLSEAGLDAELVNQQGKAQADISALVNASYPSVTLAGGGHYTVDYVDPESSTDDLAILVITGEMPIGGGGTATRTLRITLAFSPATEPSAFDYAITSSYLDVLSSQLGASDARIPLYIDSTTISQWGQNLNNRGGTVWVSKVDFFNPNNYTLFDLCPRCSDPAYFPTSPPPAPFFNTAGAKPISTLSIDLTPYYNKAIEQCVAEGNTQSACVTGAAASHHHITANKTIAGGQTGVVLEGIIYVEAGVTLTLRNDVTIKGTIVHEGVGLTSSSSRVTGSVKLAAGTDLSIDSTSPTRDFNGDGLPDAPFAPGLAIVGAPCLDNWPTTSTLGNGSSTTPGIKGSIMGGDGSGGAGEPSWSSIASSGLIEGAIVGVKGPGEQMNISGPVAAVLRTYNLNVFSIGGNANIQLKPLTGTPPGFPPPSGISSPTQRPTIQLWSD